MKNLKQLQAESEIAFREKFKCIQSDCDGHGNIPYVDENGEVCANQCQFHAEYIFPIIKLLHLREEMAWNGALEAVEQFIDKKAFNCGDRLSPEIVVMKSEIEDIINELKSKQK